MGTGKWGWRALIVGLVGFVAAGCAVDDLGVNTTIATTTTTTVRDDARTSAIADVGPPPFEATTTAPSTTSTSSSTTSSSTTTTSTTEAPSTSTTEAPSTTDPPAPTLEDRSLAFVNQKRADNGLGPLQFDPELTRIAEAWAGEMIRRQQLEHNPDLSDQVPDHYHAWGENIAYSSVAGDIDQMWWESDGHRANILGSQYTSIGIAFVEDAQGVTWAVQDFGG